MAQFLYFLPLLVVVLGIVAQVESQDFINRFAMYQTTASSNSAFHGGIATLDFYALPNLKKNQHSKVAVRVLNAMQDGLFVDELQAGWHIFPELYGDNKTHFFTFWVVDTGNSTAGCYNLQCKGFVRASGSAVAPGGVLEQVSIVGGQKYNITINIFKDRRSGDWWLYYSHNGEMKPVGYWPKSLLSTLKGHANQLIFGATATSRSTDPSPPMGSGAFPGVNSASFTAVRFVNKNGMEYQPPPGDLEVLATDPSCYRVDAFDHGRFSYGGPGGCTGQ